jgi:hypothetical protein
MQMYLFISLIRGWDSRLYPDSEQGSFLVVSMCCLKRRFVFHAVRLGHGQTG